MNKINILVVDDASFIRDLVKRTLRAHLPNSSLEEAINGRRAQSLLKQRPFDLILCDWEMPEMSGLELLTWLREQESLQDLPKSPFIMITSRGDKQHVVEAINAGVSDYMGKPFNSEQLLTKVYKALARCKKLKAAQASTAPQADPEQPQGLFINSANTLLDSSAKATTEPTSQSASVLTRTSPSQTALHSANSDPRKAKTKSQSKGKALLRIADATTEADIQAINLTQARLCIQPGSMIPQVLEPCVMDIQILGQSDQLARINGFVAAVSAS